jgi:hypothetical protein
MSSASTHIRHSTLIISPPIHTLPQTIPRRTYQPLACTSERFVKPSRCRSSSRPDRPSLPSPTPPYLSRPNPPSETAMQLAHPPLHLDHRPTSSPSAICRCLAHTLLEADRNWEGGWSGAQSVGGLRWRRASGSISVSCETDE